VQDVQLLAKPEQVEQGETQPVHDWVKLLGYNPIGHDGLQVGKVVL
jgi:hypothetical protein